mmetsp:Transcript_94867/g.306252  ORF Transcript_94867/g.306252 Transcript_94867/m.306252 type:complete len:217 (+) Transcript_94867:1976-2626(+)
MTLSILKPSSPSNRWLRTKPQPLLGTYFEIVPDSRSCLSASGLLTGPVGPASPLSGMPDSWPLRPFFFAAPLAPPGDTAATGATGAAVGTIGPGGCARGTGGFVTVVGTAVGTTGAGAAATGAGSAGAGSPSTPSATAHGPGCTASGMAAVTASVSDAMVAIYQFCLKSEVIPVDKVAKVGQELNSQTAANTAMSQGKGSIGPSLCPRSSGGRRTL